MISKIFTIGVYGYDEVGFYQKLQDAKINAFLDVRLRRGMRGRVYSFVNKTYLITNLQTMGIQYSHLKDLAPSRALREIQKHSDAQAKVKKRERIEMDPAFATVYKSSVLDPYDFQKLVNDLPLNPVRIVFFCVEKEPHACHRSLVANRLGHLIGLPVEHLLP